MGTRHLICVVKGGDFRVAQYGQWDGYPAGQGLTVLTFARDEMREDFITNLGYARFISDEELGRLWAKCGADGSGFVSMEISEKFKREYPSLSRDTSAEVLRIIQNSEKHVLLDDERDFANDSLFCEWCYVIDLDTNVLEVYEGFNKDPDADTGRFTCDEPRIAAGDDVYYPVHLVKVYPLDDLPTNKEFINDLDPPEE